MSCSKFRVVQGPIHYHISMRMHRLHEMSAFIFSGAESQIAMSLGTRGVRLHNTCRLVLTVQLSLYFHHSRHSLC